MTDHKIRCGDTVKYFYEELEVAYADYERDEFSWFGWQDGIGKLSDAVLVKACTDEEHKKAVSEWLDNEVRSNPRAANVERLYRPRAYALAWLKRARDNYAGARSALGHAEAAVRAAEVGPEDA